MRFFGIKSRVIEKLKLVPETKDNDNLLICLLLEDLEGNDLDVLTARELIERLKSGQYGSLESIRRCRQGLQEKNEDLRGKLWDKRHTMASDVKQQLRFEF